MQFFIRCVGLLKLFLIFNPPQVMRSIACSGGIVFAMSCVTVNTGSSAGRPGWGEYITHMLLRRHHMTASGL